MATRQAKGDNVGFYLRLPRDVKDAVDAEAKGRACSQAQVIVDQLRAGLGVGTVSVSVSDGAAASDAEISEWLANVDG